MEAPHLFLEICHIAKLIVRKEQTASKIYHQELQAAHKTAAQGLTIFDYCRNHSCYIQELCAILHWDFTKLYEPPLYDLQKRMIRAGKIKVEFM
jgi:hypothetical protein